MVSLVSTRMKTSFVVVAVGAVALVGNAATKGNGNGAGNSAPTMHRGSSSAPTITTATPRFNGGMPQYSGGTMPYRATVTYQNGNRTLNYPPVGNSVLRRQLHSNTNGLNSGYALQRSGNVRQPGNLRQSSAANAIVRNKLDPQTSNRLRNWGGNVSTSGQAHQNHVNNCHHHHGSNWWRNRCAAIIFFDWGWWGWYDGWWYPAWGYDPYSYYEYNEPIYGYGGLSPEQVVASVQAQLQQLGYYTYAIDGNMGPLTRSAIARYQRDHLLPITSGIDPATLGSLGIIR